MPNYPMATGKTVGQSGLTADLNTAYDNINDLHARLQAAESLNVQRDTNWVDQRHLLINGHAVGDTFAIRRIGNVVHLSMRDVATTARTNPVAYLFPVGFRPAYMKGFITNDYMRFWFINQFDNTLDSGPGGTNGHYGGTSFLTEDPFP